MYVTSTQWIWIHRLLFQSGHGCDSIQVETANRVTERCLTVNHEIAVSDSSSCCCSIPQREVETRPQSSQLSIAH